MYRGVRVGVVIPAYDEEPFVADVLRGVPAYVDRIVAIDDGSHDGTWREITSVADPRVIPLRNEKNLCVSASEVRGFVRLLETDVDVVCCMAGDGQTDPAHLPALLDEVVEGRADLAKGNRFFHRSELRSMPRFRLLGNIVISLLNKASTGYWSVSDPQHGYFAIDRRVLEAIDLDRLSRQHFHFENGMYLECNIHDFVVRDVPVPARYGDERSSIRVVPFALRLSWFLAAGLLLRVRERYWRRGRRGLALLFYAAFALLFYAAFALLGASALAGLAVALGTLAPGSPAPVPVLPLLALGAALLAAAFALDARSEPGRGGPGPAAPGRDVGAGAPRAGGAGTGAAPPPV